MPVFYPYPMIKKHKSQITF